MKSLKTSPSNDELLEVYALYKQATVGDNTTAKPGMFDLKGKAKWSAWDGKKGELRECAKETYFYASAGVSQDEAKAKYVALYEELAVKYN